MMRVVVVGSGGREHALAWALSRSEQVAQVYVAPGNAGTEWAEYISSDQKRHAPSQNVAISATDIPSLLSFAQEKLIDLTVIGPEVPLSMGIVDSFQAAGLRIFGPTKAAAQLESSKAFAKQFMRENGIPTAKFEIFDDYYAACRYIEARNCPLVVKADGLAAGKGVIVCDTTEETIKALRLVMVEKEYGPAGDLVVIEDRLEGEELSVLAFSDGSDVEIMPYTADHKRAYAFDQGPNTGGMGAYAPRYPSAKLLRQLSPHNILRRVVGAMAKRGTPYTGVLYAGLMLTADGPYVLEFNCRFGDPETQVIVPLLEDDLLRVLWGDQNWRYGDSNLRWREASNGAIATCATVVLASGGYPGKYHTGYPISGLDEVTTMPDVYVFHAGTSRRGDEIVTAGGRVVAVSAIASTLPDALDRAYTAVQHIHFEGVHYRKDIGRSTQEVTR